MKITKVTKNLVQKWLPPRKKDSNKKDFGHVLILAGSRQLSGAATLCAWGALRGGAGLVTVGIPRSIYSALLRNLRPEAMTLPLPETPEGTFSTDAAKEILNFIEQRKISSLALGPGISRHPKTTEFVQRLLQKLEGSRSQIEGIVLDADGFLALKAGEKPSLLEKLRLPIVVTPHAGEMAKFLNTTPSAVQKDRIGTAQKFAKLTGTITVLKGDKTVTTDGEKIYINTTGGPGMAKGGSGDVLTGLIAALIGQIQGEEALLKSAVMGVYIHGLAGELAQRDWGKISMLSGEIAQMLPQVFEKVFSHC